MIAPIPENEKYTVYKFQFGTVVSFKEEHQKYSSNILDLIDNF